MFAENTITHDLDGDGDVDVVQHPTTCQTIVILDSDVSAKDILRVFMVYIGSHRLACESRVLDSRRVELNAIPLPMDRFSSVSLGFGPDVELSVEVQAAAKLREFHAPMVSDPAANAAWQAKYGEWQAAKASTGEDKR